jgi:di-N-acetylchitobiase
MPHFARFVCMLALGALATVAAPAAADSGLVGNRQVIAFQVNKSNWQAYEWDTITTLVLYDGLEPTMASTAAANGVTLAWPATFPTSLLSDSLSAQEAWVAQQVERVVTTNTSGINVDFENPLPQGSPLSANLTALMLRLGDQLRKAVTAAGRIPHYSIDVAWRAGGIDGRFYDYAALGAIFDLVVVMDYDTRSQVFLPAGDACLAGANAPRATVLAGVQSFRALGIPASKLVLGTPWYGYDYPCQSGDINSQPTKPAAQCVIANRPFRGCNCSDAAGTQRDLRIITAWAATGAVARTSLIDSNATLMAATWNYNATATATMHQLWYDDAAVLGAKYGVAAELGLGGVSMWNIDSIIATTSADETPAEVTAMTKSVFAALRLYLRGQF